MNFDRLYRTVAPDSLPVSVDEARAHLMVADDSQDDYIYGLIAAATAMIDGPHGIGIALLPQTYEYSLNGLWPFTIPIYPVMSIDKIEWLDRNEVAHSSTAFRVNRRCTHAIVRHDIRGDILEESVVVTFTAGHETIPADLRQAILMLVGHFFENREATTTEKLEKVPHAVDTILARYRVA
jgi:uncharacterized phiE125 gp8 family phage protein